MAEERADLGNPKAFEVWGRNVSVFQEWSIEAQVVLELIKGDKEHLLWLAWES